MLVFNNWRFVDPIRLKNTIFNSVAELEPVEHLGGTGIVVINYVFQNRIRNRNKME